MKIWLIQGQKLSASYNLKIEEQLVPLEELEVLFLIWCTSRGNRGNRGTRSRAVYGSPE